MRALAPWLAAASILAFAIAAGLSTSGEPLWLWAINGAAIATASVVGAVLIARVPVSPIGPMLLASGVLFSLAQVAGTYAWLGAWAHPGPWPAAAAAGLINEVLFLYPLVLVLVGIPLVFPDGRFLTPRWRSIGWLSFVAVTFVTISTLFRPGTVGETPLTNPIGISGSGPMLDVLDGLASGLSVVGFGGAAASVVLRFRRGTSIERQQLKWFITAAGVAAVAFPTAFLVPSLGDIAWLVGLLALVSLPVTIGIAVLRYRLYDIDVVIRRTIVYGALLALLGALYVALVLGLQTVMSGLTGGDTLPVALSTLVIAALFGPVRARVRNVVDRRFYRSRYDAQRTIEHFAGRLRDQVELDAVGQTLLATSHEALQPAFVSIWIRRAASR